MAQTNTQSAQTLPLSYIVAAADGHVGVSWGDLLARAWARQVVVVDAAGVVAGDGGERVQRQIPVQQTARQAEREREVVDSLRIYYAACTACICRFIFPKMENYSFEESFPPH